MLSSLSLSWALTAAFVVTGAIALARLVALAAGRRAGDRLVELSHLLMSVAMVAMVWAWSGGPQSPSGIVQLAVFGVLAVGFLALTVRPDPGHARLEGGYHLLMAASMVWMVAAMPLLMGPASAGPGAADTAADTTGTGMAGMDMAGMDMAGSVPGAASPGPPAWVVAVTVALAVVLVAAAALVATRALRARPSADVLVAPPVPAPAAAVVTAPAHTTTVVATPAGRSLLAHPRTGALCHVLMSAGMAAMLAAML